MSHRWLSSVFSRPRSPGRCQRQERSLYVESLESRVLLAGDVFADVVLDYAQGSGVGDATQAPPYGNGNPAAALGAPEFDATSGLGLYVSLGNSGSISCSCSRPASTRRSPQ